MNRLRLSFTTEMLAQSGLAVASVAVTTAVLWLIGRDTLGEAVIALLYLVPIGWSASRGGQGPGLVAAVVAALTFDFFFIPPFYTLPSADWKAGWCWRSFWASPSSSSGASSRCYPKRGPASATPFSCMS